jgi:hypothetical protein
MTTIGGRRAGVANHPPILQAENMRPHRRTPRLSLVAAAVLAFAAGCQVDDTGTPSSLPSGVAGGGVSAAQSEQQLSRLTVAAGGSMSGYSRAKFPHWINQGKGCDTRDVVLENQGTGVQVSSSCKITSGTWTSPYDGRSYTDPLKLQIDHLVPLGNAWRTGASAWTTQQRQDFANDLTDPQLLAVNSSANESKGDQDPSTWKPPNQAFWCRYAEDWVAVKTVWKLTISTAEKGALSQMLGTCA